MAPMLCAPLSPRTVHLCIDMQRIFSADGLWPAPWMARVLPVVSELAGRFPERTIFTRFITPVHAEDMPGMWRRYYKKWQQATREHLDLHWLGLVDPLNTFVPPAAVVDKARYSAFAGSKLRALLEERGADGLIVTGSETDVCVLSTVLDAVDFGYRVIIVQDGVCSSSDAGHDASLEVYRKRYSVQIESAKAEEILRQWK